jgi:hypothetical protein
MTDLVSGPRTGTGTTGMVGTRVTARPVATA